MSAVKSTAVNEQEALPRYITDERVLLECIDPWGDKAIYCLNAKTGEDVVVNKSSIGQTKEEQKKWRVVEPKSD